MAKTGLKPISELIRLARIGDARSFTLLWDTHVDSLKLYLRSRMDISDAYYLDDICSRSFEKAFRQIETFDPEKGEFFSWLKIIAHNTALDVIRSTSRSRKDLVSMSEKSEAGAAENVPDDIESPEDRVIKDEESLHLQSSIEALPELYRMPAKLFLIERMPQKEIAEFLNLNYATVRTRVKRAKSLLKDMGVDVDENV